MTVKVEVRYREEVEAEQEEEGKRKASTVGKNREGFSSVLDSLASRGGGLVRGGKETSSFKFMKGVLNIQKASVHLKTERVFTGGGYRVPTKKPKAAAVLPTVPA